MQETSSHLHSLASGYIRGAGQTKNLSENTQTLNPLPASGACGLGFRMGSNKNLTNRPILPFFATLLTKRNAIQENQGTLREHILILDGSRLEWGRKHHREQLPLVLAEGGNETIASGRHVANSPETPVPNLHESLRDRVGVPCGSIADSIVPLTELSRSRSPTTLDCHLKLRITPTSET